MDRNEIMSRFERLLDAALEGETPPAGIDADILASVMADPESSKQDGDRSCDSYALWSAMTALTQEIKLQGRAFQELNLTLATQTTKIGDELRQVYAEREKMVQREAERRCRRESLGALIDLRDRLGRGRDSVRASQTEMKSREQVPWWQRLFQKDGNDPQNDTLAALNRGYELGIERLDQTLAEFNAQEIHCQGELFDPKRMNAIESEETAAVDPDIVLEVYRSGYEWNGEVFRPAQVKVSRQPAVKK